MELFLIGLCMASMFASLLALGAAVWVGKMASHDADYWDTKIEKLRSDVVGVNHQVVSTLNNLNAANKLVNEQMKVISEKVVTKTELADWIKREAH